MIKKFMKAVFAVMLACTSYVGFFILEDEKFAWVRLILFIQALVWNAVAYELGMDCVDDKERFSLLPAEEEWNSDTYDDEL